MYRHSYGLYEPLILDLIHCSMKKKEQLQFFLSRQNLKTLLVFCWFYRYLKEKRIFKNLPLDEELNGRHFSMKMFP